MQTKMIVPALLLFCSVNCTAQKNVTAAQEQQSKQLSIAASFSMYIQVSDAATHFNLVVNNPEKKRLNVLISNSGLGVLVDTVISQSSFNQRYNMNMVEDGQYLITVKNGKEQQTRKVELKTVVTRNMELVK